jgi:hypothetical protein
MAEQYVRINGKTFLYKQKAPFSASGMSVFAAIEYDPEADKVRCHECGDWFEQLGKHFASAHGMTARNYKIKHGLNLNSAMVNEKIRISHSRSQAARVAADPEKHRLILLKARMACAFRGRTNHRPFAEKRNERNTCPAQLIEKIKQAADHFGGTPTKKELSASGISLDSAFLALNVKNVGSLVSLAGLSPNLSHKRRRYSEVILIEMLRDFYVCHGRLPRLTDHRRGLLPSTSSFYSYFGGMKKAYRAAGLALVAAAEGGV